jgi:hypothetical protein
MPRADNDGLKAPAPLMTGPARGGAAPLPGALTRTASATPRNVGAFAPGIFFLDAQRRSLAPRALPGVRVPVDRT